MDVFKPLMDQKVKDNEGAVRSYWDEIDLLRLSETEREGCPSYIFYEGPPTANGMPGIHHVIARVLKDAVCRHQIMEGYQVKRKAGWDTHGLPVEIEVEKQLNLNSKQEIEEYGIAAFNEKCRESVFKYESAWREMTRRMAYEIDLDHPYITLDNDYIESVWWILDQFYKKGLIYEGHKILPYCSRCGTGLASHEVAQGYEEIKTTTVYVKFKRRDADEYFLVWTTTPWTLASNVALTVNPKETYQKVRYEDTVYYIEKNLAPKVLEGEYEVLDEMPGKDLEYIEYEQLMPFVKAPEGAKAFFVTLADYVTTEDGTGIVHTAPAFGEDDYRTGVKYGLPVLQPVDETGKYTTTPWEGMFVMDADIEILKWLYGEGKLFKKEKVAHNYPHCWRCHTPLLYYAKPSWYIRVTDFQDLLIANNDSVDWYPPYVGEKRFGNWLTELKDWAISRSRYWGTPLPIWRCGCGHCESVGSRAELAERAVEDIDESIELHRPYVDEIHLKCPECGELMERVPDVIDCWFDSGSMPFAQQHYPFENKENFDELFPADFICEGLDQTRGWFYSLLAIATFIKGRSPYKQVLVNDLILDKDGKKMSKSRGNSVNPFELFDQYGADALRWYLLYVSPVWSPTRFDVDGLSEVLSKFFGTFKNVYTFFAMYANTDGVDPRSFDVSYENRAELDRWILSKYHRLVGDVREQWEGFDLNKMVRLVQNFVNEDLSNWYIRRSRRRFWASELDMDKMAVYRTTYEVLEGLCRLIAPIAPYIAEEMYRDLTGAVSVHLAMYPEQEAGCLDDRLEEKMDLVRDLVTLGRASRESARIKVRQPLSEVLIDGKYRPIMEDLVPLIKEELNVKDVVFEEDLHQYMHFTLKPNFRVAGPQLGPKIKVFGKVLNDLNAADIAPRLESGESVEIDLEGTPYTINEDNVQVSISAKEGFDVAMEGNKFVILDTSLTPELTAEGLAREFVSKVQQLRKQSGFEVMDNIHIRYAGDDETGKALSTWREYVMKETLAETLERKDSVQGQETDLNGHSTQIEVEKAQ